MLAHLGLTHYDWAQMAQSIASRRHGGIAMRPGSRPPRRSPVARFWRECLKRKLIARDAGRRLSGVGQDAAPSAQASDRCIVPERRAWQHQSAESTPAPPSVCGLRAFYGLMTLDETGVLCARATRRGEAERDPLHPIRVIPAREVSGSQLFFHSPAGQRPSLDAPFARPASPAGFVLGYVRLLPYGKDTMTAHSSVYCFVRPLTGHACLRVPAGRR